MTAAGWYDDGSGQQRWWDGQQWTEHVAGAAAATHHIGAYPVTHELGRGSFGVVYLGTHPTTATPVAVKVFTAAGPEARASLQRETQGLLAVRSPFCLQVIDVIDTPQTLALVTEYVPGVTLRTLMDEQGPLSGPEALQVLWGAGQGLAVVHTAGLVHGDIKPANMLVTPEGASKLIDFGLVGAPGLAAPDGSTSGSPAYAAPEQMLHGHRDRRSDIYALSVTLFEVLCGQRPYTEASLPELAMAHAQNPVPDPRALAPHLSATLAELVMAGMAKDPATRPQDMAEFLDRFQRGASETFGADWLVAGGLAATAAALVATGAFASGVVASGSAAAGGVVALAAGTGGVAGAGGAGAVGAAGAAGVVGAGGVVGGGTGAAGSLATTAALTGGAKAALIGAATVAAVTTGVGGIALGVTQPPSPPTHQVQPASSSADGDTAAPVANTASSTTNLVLVIDVSTSMSDPARPCDEYDSGCDDEQTKLEASQEAALSLIGMVQRQGSDAGVTKLGIVSFSDGASTLVPMGTDYQDALDAVSGLDVIGGTDIAAGIDEGVSDLLEQSGTKTIVLLTDGESNADDATYAAQEAADAGVTIYTVGFGDSSQLGSDAGVNEDLLSDIASTTGGEYHFADNGTLLRQIFWEARYGSIGSVVASDQGHLSAGESSAVTQATVEPGQGTLEVALAWPGSNMNVVLTDPSGTVVAQGDSGANIVHEDTQEFVTIKNPKAGDWKVQVKATETNGAEQYGVVAATYGVSTQAAPLWPKIVLGVGVGGLVLVLCWGIWRLVRRATA